MALTAVTRARVILDLIKDGIVTTEANYGSGIDKITAAATQKYVDGLLREQPIEPLFDTQNPPQPRQPTNEELAENFILFLRNQIKRLHIQNKIATDREAQYITSKTTAETEATADLG